MNLNGLKYLVVGCGFWGSVFAERIASILNEKVLIIDKRNHIGGNSFSDIDQNTGIEYHKYGSHIFHTSFQDVWEYINQFTDFNNYRHKVLITYKNNIYSMPINLGTINSFYNLNLTPSEAKIFIEEEIKKTKINNPQNLEEKAISLIGKPLYEAFVKGYTQKQWEISAKTLPESIITRLPVRFNYNANYFSDLFEGIPLNGYGKLFENILSNKNIEIKLNTNFYDIKEQIPKDCKIIFTGMIDEFFNYKYGKLAWRSLDFKWERPNLFDYQGIAQMNFGDVEIPYTRIHEFKHYHPERLSIFNSNKTIISFEYSKTFTGNDDAYYPINDKINSEIYSLYEKEIESTPNLIVGGRLGSYKYWDMDKTIKNALDKFNMLMQ